MTYAEINGRIDRALEDVLCQIYKDGGIKNGDIDLFQVLTLEKLEDDLTILFMELYNQNK